MTGWLLFLLCVLVTIGLVKDRPGPENRAEKIVLIWAAWILVAILALLWSAYTASEREREAIVDRATGAESTSYRP